MSRYGVMRVPRYAVLLRLLVVVGLVALHHLAGGEHRSGHSPAAAHPAVSAGMVMSPASPPAAAMGGSELHQPAALAATLSDAAGRLPFRVRR